jgi:hypothetical protein
MKKKDLIAELREALGEYRKNHPNFAHLSERTGVSEDQICRIRRGESQGSPLSRKHLRRCLGMRPEPSNLQLVVNRQDPSGKYRGSDVCKAYTAKHVLRLATFWKNSKNAKEGSREWRARQNIEELVSVTVLRDALGNRLEVGYQLIDHIRDHILFKDPAAHIPGEWHKKTQQLWEDEAAVDARADQFDVKEPSLHEHWAGMTPQKLEQLTRDEGNNTLWVFTLYVMERIYYLHDVVGLSWEKISLDTGVSSTSDAYGKVPGSHLVERLTKAWGFTWDRFQQVARDFAERRLAAMKKLPKQQSLPFDKVAPAPVPKPVVAPAVAPEVTLLRAEVAKMRQQLDTLEKRHAEEIRALKTRHGETVRALMDTIAKLTRDDEPQAAVQ